jgi:dTDP-glucose 4,6-dehydratase
MILVVGSNSFSGAHFIDYCLTQSYSDVIGISRSREYKHAYLPYRWNKNSDSKFKFHKLDLNNDLERIVDLVAQEKPKYIVNFAAQGMVAQSWEQPKDWLNTNTLGHIMLHDKLRKFDFIEKYVHVSTPEVYGNTSNEIDESAPINPSTPYAVSKAACDLSLKCFYERYNFPVVFTRAANVYGPAQQLYRIIPRTIIGVLTNNNLNLDGGGHSIRSFLHIKDACVATYKIMENADPPEVFHLTNRDFYSIRQIVETILEEMGENFDKHVKVSNERPGKDMAYTLKPDKIEKELGWSAKISLRDGIKETIAWVKKHFDFLRYEHLTYKHKP